jgi:hypothetical protein
MVKSNLAKWKGKMGAWENKKRNNKKYETFCFIFCMMKNW